MQSSVESPAAPPAASEQSLASSAATSRPTPPAALHKKSPASSSASPAGDRASNVPLALSAKNMVWGELLRGVGREAVPCAFAIAAFVAHRLSSFCLTALSPSARSRSAA